MKVIKFNEKIKIIWLILRKGIGKYLIKNFDLYVPSSAGDTKSLGFHTKNSIIFVFPLLLKLIKILNFKTKIISANKFFLKKKMIKETKLLKKFFNFYGSDKSTIHNYHLIYGSLFKNKTKVRKVLEIGLGTDDENIISNIGRFGKPGASVRAFRDFFKKANIYGADIDKKILFSEGRIKTFFVDQTDINSLNKMYKKIGKNFDLIVDDGLHAPYSNINVIISGLNNLKKDGWIIIEDIPLKAKPLWELINLLISFRHYSIIIKAKQSLMFLIKKK